MTFRWLFMLSLITLHPWLLRAYAGDVPQEYLVKAKYLANIPLYTELPGRALKGDSYTICLMGETPLEHLLESSRGKLIEKRPLAVRTVEEASQMDRCQVLFIASSERHRLQALLPEAQRRGILTISDMRNFTRLGGMINLQTLDNRMVFDMNLVAAGKASISFSSHLLKLAHDVIK